MSKLTKLQHIHDELVKLSNSPHADFFFSEHLEDAYDSVSEAINDYKETLYRKQHPKEVARISHQLEKENREADKLIKLNKEGKTPAKHFTLASNSSRKLHDIYRE